MRAGRDAGCCTSAFFFFSASSSMPSNRSRPEIVCLMRFSLESGLVVALGCWLSPDASHRDGRCRHLAGVALGEQLHRHCVDGRLPSCLGRRCEGPPGDAPAVIVGVSVMLAATAAEGMRVCSCSILPRTDSVCFVRMLSQHKPSFRSFMPAGIPLTRVPTVSSVAIV